MALVVSGNFGRDSTNSLLALIPICFAFGELFGRSLLQLANINLESVEFSDELVLFEGQFLELSG